MIRHAFDPVVDERTRLLILGSLPGEASLTAGEYYAHPRNAFWRLMDRLIGIDVSTLPYGERLGRLKGAGIGLWDVVASAERRGSLDSAIRSPDVADVNSLIARLPALKAVAFNGATASRIGQTILDAQPANLTLLTLPSSSPAHARPLAEKAENWAMLKAFLQD